MTADFQLPGVVLGEILGAGGMGAVYAGVESATGRAVAVKVLTQPRVTDAARRRFEREARATLALSHPNICAAFDFGALENGRLYLVMERLDGDDLSAVLAQERALSLTDTVRVGVEAAAGLAAAHAVGLIHRDVKPSNLFLHRKTAGAPPVVKVVDFGLAVAVSGESDMTRVTRTGEVLGTPAYMAPEQGRGDRGIDHRVDIYALGAVLYHALCGAPPFGRGGAVEVLVRALTEPLPPLAPRRPDAPAALVALIESALSRAPEDRPQSMAEFRDRLAAIEVVDSGPLPFARPPPIDLAIDRRIVTVLIASGVMNVRSVVDTIEAHGGEATVVGAVGQVVGVFGGERSLGDEADRAVRAALALEKTANSIGVGTSRADSVGGLYSSPIAGGAGAETLIAGGPGVRIDAETFNRTRGRFRVEGDRVVGPAGEDLMVPTSPFVGRDGELTELSGVLRRAFDEQEAAIALVTGPPGIGKSRLVQAVVDGASEALVALGRGDSTRRYSSWALLGEVLSNLALAHSPRGTPAVALDAVTRELDLDADACDALRHAAGVASRGGVGAGPAVDVSAVKDRLLVAVGDLLEGLAGTSPLLIVIDDAHEADTPSLELLDVVLRRCRGAAVGLVVAAREHFITDHPERFDGPMVRRLALRELGKRAAVRLGQSLGLSELEATDVAVRTGGNPLFVEQVALAARSTGSAGVLPTIEDAIQARLDPLPRPVREALRVAAAFGARFSAAGLAEVGVSEPRGVLDRMLRDDLIAAERRRPGDRASSSDARAAEGYVFRCTLLRDVAYAALTDAQRRDIHGRIGTWIAGGAGLAAEAAHHLSLGPRPERAIPLWLRAARDAVGEGDLGAARAGLDVALPLALGTPDELAVRLERLGVLVREVDVPMARAELTNLLAVAPPDARSRAELAYWRGAIDQWEGRYVDSRGAFAEAASLFDSVGDSIAVSRALAMEAVQICTGRLGDARLLADRAIDVAGTDPGARSRALHTRYYVAGYADKPAVARGFGQAALVACEAARDHRRALEVLTTLAADELELGHHDAARARLVDVIARCQRLGNRSAEGYALHNLGVALARLREPGAAIDHQTRALDLALALRHGRLAGAALYHRALARLQIGDYSGADEDARGALPMVVDSTEEASALTALAMVHAATGGISEGLAAVRRARALCDSTGQRPELEAELLAAEVDLLQRSGQHALAQTRRSEAAAVLLARAEALTDSPEERDRYLMATPARLRLLDAPTQAE